MADQNARERLVDFLDRRAFQPVLRAREEDYPQNKRDELQHARSATERERDRFRNYDSAQKVYRMYRDDLTSDEAKQVDRELRDLGLPTLTDCREEFEQEARRLGVH